MINWNFCNTRCGKWVAHQRAAHESPARTKADQSTASPFGWVQVGSVDEEENWDAAYLRRSSPLAPCPTPHRSAQSSMRERSRIAVPAHPAPSRRSPSRVAGDGSRRRRRTAALASSMSRRGGLRGSATSQTVVGLPRLAVGWRVGCARRGVAGPSSFHPAVVTGERWERNPASASRAVVDIHRGARRWTATRHGAWMRCVPPVGERPPTGRACGGVGRPERTDEGASAGTEKEESVVGPHGGASAPESSVAAARPRPASHPPTPLSSPPPGQASWPRPRRHRRPSMASQPTPPALHTTPSPRYRPHTASSPPSPSPPTTALPTSVRRISDVPAPMV